MPEEKSDEAAMYDAFEAGDQFLREKLRRIARLEKKVRKLQRKLKEKQK